MTAKRLLKKSGKILLYIIGIFLFLIVALLIFINTDYGKRVVKNKAQAYLQKKLNTKVVIGSVDYSLPKWVELNNVYIEDQHKDTLLYGQQVSIDLDMFKLIRGDTYIRKVQLKNMYANIYRNENDSNFNYQFIIDAFAGNSSAPQVIKDTAALKLTLKKILLDTVRLKFEDRNAGLNMYAAITSLMVDIKTFQPDRLQFDVDKFVSNGVAFSMLTYKENKSVKKIDSTTAYSLQLVAGLVDLSAVNISIEDRTTGMLYSNNVRHLSLDKANINLTTGKMSGGKLLLDSSLIKFISPREIALVDTSSTSATSSAISIGLDEISMKNNQFRFDNNNLAAKEGFDPAHIDMQGIKLNATKIFYNADSIVAGISELAFADKSGFKLDTTHADIVYTNHGISATALYVKTPQSLIQNSVAISYADLKQLAKDPQNSKVAISLKNSTIAVNDLYTLVPFVKKSMPPEKFKNNVINLNTEINGTLQQLNIPTLQLAGFSGTILNARAVLYNIMDSNNLAYDITIFNSSIPRADILKFMPAGTDQATTDKIPLVLSLSTHFRGNVKNASADININSTSFRLTGNADLKDFRDPKKLQYNINIRESRIEKSFISSLLPAGTIPSSINLPAVITATGTAKGDMNNIQPDLKLGGSYGTVTVKGFVRNFKNKEAASYDLRFATSNFEAGKLLKQDSVLGTVTLTGSAKGRGFDYKTMNAVINTDIQSAEFKKYTYHNASLTADLVNGRVNSTGNVNDSNLRMNYQVSANLSGQYPADVTAKILLDTVQLQQLHLYKDTLNASFTANVRAADLNPDRLNFYADIDSSRFEVKGRHYMLDSIVAKAETSNGNNTISLRSPFADADATGKFDYDKLGTSIMQYVNKYYKISKQPAENIPPQQIAFEGVIKKHPLVTDIVTGLDYKDINFKGNYFSSGGDSALNLNATVPYLDYQGKKVSQGVIAIRSLNDKINTDVNFDTLRYGSNVFYKTNITANIANDSLGITAVTKDVKNKDRFAAGANIKINNTNEYVFSLKQRLLLNYQEWTVSGDNKITYSPEGILVNDFAISGDSGRIVANSRQNVLNSPIDVNIQNFNIRDIFTLVNQDTLLASGTLNGKLAISDFNKQIPAFTGDMTLSSLQIKQQPIGDVKFTASKKDDNTIDATLALTGNGNDVSMDGRYFLDNEQQQFEANMKIRELSMKTLQSLSNGSISNASGKISGDLAVNGKFADPRYKGVISFDTTKFTLTQLGTAYAIDQQKITLDYPSISLNHFIIKDVDGHTMTVNGNIKENTMTEYDLNLDIKATNFTLVNAPKAINNQVYGYAAVDANINVSGNSTRPDIQGDISLNDKSDVTLILPESNSSKDAARSVVRFIDRDTFALPEQQKFVPLGDVQSNFAQFLNYNLNIEVGKKAALTVVIDPSTGDELKVQGDAQLNAGVDPGGNIILAGNYELNSGYYVLNYQFLTRKFELQPGSTIAFSGAPMDAQINISAVYTVNTSPKELLGNEVGDVDPKLSNMFNQKIPFKVFLYLKGQMKKPEISFDIQLPDENTQLNSQLRSTIENKLVQLRGDVAATDKQVFALLLLNRFVGEQSADFFKGSGSGSDFSEVARESVSKFLSSALDQIAGDLFKGVDIDLNLNSYQDFSTGDPTQKTDLNIAVTKNFLNDRLSVSVGRNFGIEGQDATSKAANGIIPDVTVNYKLTQDGKYLLRAYKKTQYEVILDGYVVETGVAFIVTMDYDKFKELFRKKRKS
ncbi:MAG: translocation/assembly module TamB domain-containing protein [Ferruginibacter sp.]